MFALALGAKRAAASPSLKRRSGRKEMTTVTAEPLLAEPVIDVIPPLTTWDVTAPDGTYAGAFEGSTPEDAILSYVATLGYASIDDAALAFGFADAVTYMAAFVVTETLTPAGMDPALAPVDPLAAPAALSRRGRRPRYVKDGSLIPVEAGTPAIEPVVTGNVTVVEPVIRRYRAVVSRSVNATAVVEFDAYEDEDLWAIAKALVPQIPAEAWSVTVNGDDTYGYIDRIEPISPAADPALATLSRRGRLARKAAYMISESGAEPVGPYEAATPEEAVALYIAELGFATADEAAAALGYASTESFLDAIVATEQLSEIDPLVDDEEDEEVPPATLARRRRASKTWTMDNTEGFTQEDLDLINDAFEIISASHPGVDAYTIDDALNNAWLGQLSAEELADDAMRALGLEPAQLSDDEPLPDEEEDDEEIPPATLGRRR